MRYRNPAIKQLRDQQIKYAPRDVQLTQISRAERLLDELNPVGSYRYPELCEKITTYRGEMYPDLVVSGAEAVHDLRCFVEDLSDMPISPLKMPGKRFGLSKTSANASTCRRRPCRGGAIVAW